MYINESDFKKMSDGIFATGVIGEKSEIFNFIEGSHLTKYYRFPVRWTAFKYRENWTITYISLKTPYDPFEAYEGDPIKHRELVYSLVNCDSAVLDRYTFGSIPKQFLNLPLLQPSMIVNNLSKTIVYQVSDTIKEELKKLKDGDAIKNLGYIIISQAITVFMILVYIWLRH